MVMRTALIVWLCASWACAASAADTNPGQMAPPTDVQGAGSLSDKLSQTGGVIHPQQNSDPGISKPVPPSGSTPMPVIPSPGSPGGDPSVTPK